MPKISKQTHDGVDRGGYRGRLADAELRARRAKLVPDDDVVVHVASFNFRFSTNEQLKDCLAYFESKTRRTSRISAKTLEREFGENWKDLRSWEVERWRERLPMYLLEEPKRQKVVKALRKALEAWASGSL